MSIRTALISVYHKTGLEDLARGLDARGVKLFATGGTYDFIRNLGIQATPVEDITEFPSILAVE